MNQALFRPTAAGRYRAAKMNQRLSPKPNNPNTTKPKASSPLPNQNKQQPKDLLQLVQSEFQRNNVNTDLVDQLQALVNIFRSEEGRRYYRMLVDNTNKVMKKIPYKEVMSLMSKDQNLSELLKNLGNSGNISDALKTMMDNPEMKKTAMDMMQEMMSDEKKMAEMTEMMSKMLNPDKK